MTGNYINYIKHQESVRHNTAVEKETNRANLANEKEVNRHNAAVETETHRHNVTVEQQGWAQVKEQNRHNVATEQISADQYHESVRHNIATEGTQYIQAEASKSNAVANQIQAAASKLQSEAAWETSQVAWDKAKTEKYNAQTQRDYVTAQSAALGLNALTGSQSVSETHRHNIATEIDKDEELSYQEIRTRAEAFKDISVGIQNYAKTIETGWKMVTGKVSSAR